MKYLKKSKLIKELDIKPCNIIISHTEAVNNPESNRMILLKSMGTVYDLNGIIDNDHDYIVIEGYHCSCYDYDDTEWSGTLYKTNELKKLAQAEYNHDEPFWKLVREYFNII